MFRKTNLKLFFYNILKKNISQLFLGIKLFENSNIKMVLLTYTMCDTKGFRNIFHVFSSHFIKNN